MLNKKNSMQYFTVVPQMCKESFKRLKRNKTLIVIASDKAYE